MTDTHNLNELFHFSIDDVIDVFRDIYETKPDSIFDIPFFATLREWNEKYDIVTDLYVFEKKDNFSIDMLQDRYWDEIRKCSSWLHIGWHQITCGEVSASVQEQIESLNRVFDLIIQHCGAGSWSRGVRLHRWQADSKLIQALREKWVHTLFTSDRADQISYDLSIAESERVWQNGWYRRKPNEMAYARTDIRLDYFEDGLGKDEYLEMTKRSINITPGRVTMRIFCHEKHFLNIRDRAEAFFQEFPRIEKTVYFNAAVKVCDQLYFTTVNTDFLYKMNMETKEIQVVTDIPYQTYGMHFSSITYYDGKLFMVPRLEGRIFVYDIEKNSFLLIDLPYSDKALKKKNEHRKAIAYKNYLWILPTEIKGIVRLDMNDYTIRLFKRFPKGVTFKENAAMTFKNMDLYDDRLYLFSDACSHNLIVNAETGRIRKWNERFNGVFGMMVDENVAVLSPTYEYTGIGIYDNTLGTIRQIGLSHDIWVGAKTYAYWFLYKIKDTVFIMPREAGAILTLNLKDFSASYFKTNEKGYESTLPNNEFVGYEVIERGDEIWIISFSGNRVIRFTSEGHYKDYFDISVPLGTLRKIKRLKIGVVSEQRTGELERFRDLLGLGMIEGKNIRWKKAE